MLKERFKNELPKDVLPEVELARLVGQQDVIDFITDVLHLDIKEEDLNDK